MLLMVEYSVEFETAFGESGAVCFRDPLAFQGFVFELSDLLSSVPAAGVLLESLKVKNLLHFYHSLRVGLLFHDLMNQFGSSEIPFAGVAGVLHDVGKVFIPDVVLCKPGRHDVFERKVMEAHNRLGYLSIIGSDLRDRLPGLAELAVYHHKYPRTGSERRDSERRQLVLFPDVGERSGERRALQRRFRNEVLESSGRFLMIADIFDALRSRRDYKPSFDEGKTKTIIEETFCGSSEISSCADYLLGAYGVND